MPTCNCFQTLIQKLILQKSQYPRDEQCRERKALFHDQRMEKKELCSQISFSTPWALKCCRYRTGIMRERDRLGKRRRIHVFSGNRQRSFRNLDATSFYAFHGLVFLIIVDG
jgi:hypothetical protein